jgi:UDP-N-acetylglucosamine 2-epimerase (non-hydrolysing)
LVMRDVTERPEAVESGCAALVGADEEKIKSSVHRLLTDEAAYRAMSQVQNPFGEGDAAIKIASYCRQMSME